MKYIIVKKFMLIFLSILSLGTCYPQTHRQVEVKPFIDTTTVTFKNIFGFWENYLDTLSYYNSKSHYQLKKTNESINAFWMQYDRENYDFPDLVYATNFGMSFYPSYLENEYFLGFARRDTNLYEIRTMFVSRNDEIFHNFPDIMFSMFLVRDGDSYKLYNKFSHLLKEKKIIKKKIGDVNYYYSPFYHFNDEKAHLLTKRIKKFKQGFDIDRQMNIKYIVSDNFTEILSWFGVNYYSVDYYGSLSTIEGRAFPINNMIFSGNGGENYMHEIIHILLKDFRKGKYSYFEEGIACFFGDHKGKSYAFHAKRLKKYLHQNSWIDLSKNLQGYYSNALNEHGYIIQDEKNPMKDFEFYKDDTTEFTYIINAVLCEMAFRQGGYEKVMKILKEKADNVAEFYRVIEKELGIKQKDMDEVIKGFLEKNY